MVDLPLATVTFNTGVENVESTPRREVELHLLRSLATRVPYSLLPTPPYVHLRSDDCYSGNWSSLGICYDSATLISNAVFPPERFVGKNTGLAFNSLRNVQSFKSWFDGEENQGKGLPFLVEVDFALNDTSPEWVSRNG